MKTITLRYFADPGHGWVRVKKERLSKLGIENKISSCSYERNGNAYLEEDCDFAVLSNALEALGYKVNIKQSHTNKQSKIRSYKCYSI